MNREPGMAYDMKVLNKVFAILSLCFLVVVIWIFLDDYLRPWKGFQIQALKIKKEVLQQKISDFEKTFDSSKLLQLEDDLKNAQNMIKSRQGEFDLLNKKLTEVDGIIYAENMQNGQYNACVSATNSEYGAAISHHHPKKAEKLLKKLQDCKVLFAKSKDKLKDLEKQKKEINRKLISLRSEEIEVKKDILELVGKKELMMKAKEKTQIGPVTILRNMPMIDYLDPTIKIQQVVINRFINNDDFYFQKVDKVDRCMTCHAMINEEGYEDQENPYKTHPDLNLFMGKDSPHPMKEFGCTTCHGGEGHRVHDFSSAAHTPQNEEQAQLWREKYDWHPPHKVARPMLKVGQTESSCFKCHQNVERIPQANINNNGRQLIEDFGCYNCHKIKGYEHLKKSGPSLLKIRGKLTKTYMKNWIWAPTLLNPKAKMPSYFNQSNNSKKEFVLKSITEVNSIVEYLYKNSSGYRPGYNYKKGDAEKGKELIAEVGCVACHMVEGIPNSFKAKGRRGPYLTNLANKLDPDWLVDWLIRPSHYQEDTIMPSFRLTKKEAVDMTAYLLSLNSNQRGKTQFAPLDKSLRDEILISYLSAFDTEKGAKNQLNKMSDSEKTIELGKRSINKYGCFSCHSIQGFENSAPIGAELSNFGLKPVWQMDFGHEQIPHERDSWFTSHLENTRRWDNGKDKSFGDLNKMPNFKLTADEINAMTVTILGYTGEELPELGIRRLTPEEGISEAGRQVFHQYNCKACHQVDGEYGDILKMYKEDINEGPPRLIDQGSRVHANWLFHFLENVTPIRPWLEIRMPSFNLSIEERNKLVNYFQYKSKAKTFEAPAKKVAWEPGEKAAAKELFSEVLACNSCHTQGISDDEPMAPDLRISKVRLRESWIEKWIEDPQSIMPGTTMPSFWEDDENPAPEILGGDKKRQVRALTKLVLEMGEK